MPSPDAVASLDAAPEAPPAVACKALTAATAAGPVAWICCAVLADADGAGTEAPENEGADAVPAQQMYTFSASQTLVYWLQRTLMLDLSGNAPIEVVAYKHAVCMSLHLKQQMLVILSAWDVQAACAVAAGGWLAKGSRCPSGTALATHNRCVAVRVVDDMLCNPVWSGCFLRAVVETQRCVLMS